MLAKNFKDYTRCEPETYKRNLLWYLEELDRLINERVLKYEELLMKEIEVQAIKEIEKWLKESEMQKQGSLVSAVAALEASLVIEGAVLEASLGTEGTTLEASLVTKGVVLETRNDADADIGPLDDSDTVTKTDQTLRMFLLKEDNVNTGKQGLGFENQNDDVNPSLLNKAKELAPCLYNIDEMGKDSLSDQKISSEEELKCEAEKRLKVKQRISPL
ncbi:hypothetical protein Tco_1085013 [Tanacetum coccineum]